MESDLEASALDQKARIASQTRGRHKQLPHRLVKLVEITQKYQGSQVVLLEADQRLTVQPWESEA